MKRILFLLFFLLLFCNHSFADIVVLKNGDRLTGKVEKVRDGKLYFNSKMVGDVTIDTSQIEHINTDEPFEIELQDGTIVKSRVLRDGAGQIVTEKPHAQKIPISEVKTIFTPDKAYWEGAVSLGLSSSVYDKLTESATFSFDVARETRKNSLHTDGVYLYTRERLQGESEKRITEDSFFMNAQYNYFYTDRILGFGNGHFKTDHVNDLDYRYIAGLGAGYKLIKKKNIKFTPEAGLAYLTEQYTTKVGDTGPVVEEKDDRAAAQFGYQFRAETSIRDRKVRLTSKMKYYPSLSDSYSDYLLNLDGELRFSLTKYMFASIKGIFSYDATPAQDLPTTDRKTIISFGWQF